MSARRRLLLCLANYEDWRAEEERKRAMEVEAGNVVGIRTGRPPIPGLYPTHTPLWVTDWKGLRKADVALAAKEAGKLGEIEYHDAGHPNGPMVRITDKGRATLIIESNGDSNG